MQWTLWTSLLPRAEVVILILPSTAETSGLIGPRQFALMRQGTLLVNAARGPIVDTSALVDALNGAAKFEPLSM